MGKRSKAPPLHCSKARTRAIWPTRIATAVERYLLTRSTGDFVRFHKSAPPQKSTHPHWCPGGICVWSCDFAPPLAHRQIAFRTSHLCHGRVQAPSNLSKRKHRCVHGGIRCSRRGSATSRPCGAAASCLAIPRRGHPCGGRSVQIPMHESRKSINQ